MTRARQTAIAPNQNLISLSTIADKYSFETKKIMAKRKSNETLDIFEE